MDNDKRCSFAILEEARCRWGLVHGMARLHSEMEMMKGSHIVQCFENWPADLDTDIPSAQHVSQRMLRRSRRGTNVNFSNALALRRATRNSVFINLPQLESYM